MSGASPRFEVGLAMAGAISAGAYSSGVIDFLFQALDAWEREKRDNPAGVPDHAVVVKVITGASAGSITGALAATALATGIRPTSYPADPDPLPGDRSQPYRYVLPALYTAWVKRPDMASDDGNDLLATSDLKSGRQVFSLLDSSLLDWIGREALTIPDEQQPGSEFAPARGRERIPYLADPLHLYMTVSNLRGVPYQISFRGASHGYGMLSHGDRVHYLLDGLGAQPAESSFARDDPGITLDIKSLPKRGHELPETWLQYLQAALASSAFPLGLAPRRLQCTTTDYNHRMWPFYVDLTNAVKAEETIMPEWPKPWFQPPARDYAFVNVDGGLINNEPFELARFALIDAGRMANKRDAFDADRAVIMVDPFPENPAFESDENETGLGLTSVPARLFSALKNQARFKPEELALAINESVYSRFLIAPQRADESGKNVPEGFAIATGLLGGFGGFLDRRLRAFDYQLGRRNCQRFLRNVFGLDPSNPLFADWRDRAGANGEKLSDDRRFWYLNDRNEKRLCIIPLVGDASKEIALPAWPRLSMERVQVIVERAIKRASELVPRLIAGETTSRLLRLVLRAGWSIFGPQRARDYLRLKIQQDLIRRDQHADFHFVDDEERAVFSALSDPAFDYRTLGGLQRSTGLSTQDVQSILGRYPDRLYVARGQAPEGTDGYTLAGRRPGWMARTAGPVLQPPTFG